jgi:regulator of sirC expression with transglutaminase-like and TPR domain
MSLPFSLSSPSALDYFSSLVSEDESFALLEAAILLGQDADPWLDAQSVVAEIDALALRLKQRLPADAPVLHRVRLLNQYFFKELGFSANANDFYDPDNSYLHRVLATRRGIPVSLALLYGEIAVQIGVPAVGISFPGHFLVKVQLPQAAVIVDPLSGRAMGREELEERLDPYRRQQGMVGDFEVPLGLFLQAAAPRDVLARMLGNLKLIHERAQDWPALLAVQERMVRLMPEAWAERRDRGRAYAELGQRDAAVEDLGSYLRECPAAADAGAVAERVAALLEGRPAKPRGPHSPSAAT